MSSRNPQLYIQDILQACEDILNFTKTIDSAEKLQKDRPRWANEEEVRKSWLKHIENETGIKFHAERGRNDASYNQVIIEFKDKGLFKGTTKSASFKEASETWLSDLRETLRCAQGHHPDLDLQMVEGQK